MNDLNIMLLFPEIFLTIIGMSFLLFGVFKGNRVTDALCWSACIGFALSALILIRSGFDSDTLLNGMLVHNSFTSVLKMLILAGLTSSLALSVRYLYQERIARFEYPVLVIFAGVGMMLMVSANNFLSLYMALELQSLSLYVLTAFHRNSLKSGEAAVKYFILGALSSGMMLFGISLVYGYTGSLDFIVIQQTINGLGLIPPGFTIGMVFIITAMVFKLSAAPFHMWTPDVYQGAPTSVTALFAVVPKIAAIGVLIRILYVPFEGAQVQWVQVLYFVCLASLFVGSFGAIAQRNIKRLFAYSTIGNIGYALIGVISGTVSGVAAVLAFFSIYMVMTIGIFAIIICMRRNGLSVDKIDDLAGLSRQNPLLAYAMAALLFSMSGIPPLAGFFGKLVIFNAAIASGFYVLAVFGVIASVVAAYYYINIIKIMFFDEPAHPFDDEISMANRMIIIISVLFVVLFIFKLDLILDATSGAAESLI